MRLTQLGENNSMYDKHHSEEAKRKISRKGKLKWQNPEFKQKMRLAQLGRHFSDETKEKIRIAQSGEKGYWYGKCLSKETREKMAIAQLGKHSYKHSQETKEKLRIAHLGLQIGEKHWNWQGGITSLVEQIRKCFKYRQWRSDIFTRDRFQCHDCGHKGGRIEAHHKKSFSSILQYYEITTLEEALNCEELWNINNGITLCEDCHKNVYRKNTIKEGD